jgi:hypothetical protein
MEAVIAAYEKTQAIKKGTGMRIVVRSHSTLAHPTGC